MSKNVPIFDFKLEEEFRQEFLDGCESIFDEAYLTNHTYVRKFEKQFAEFSGAKYSLAVSNGTAALEVALKSIDVEGKEVIIPSNTFIATYNAVINAGAIPVVVDIEDQFFSISPEQVEDKMSNKTAAVITVHIGGHISPSVEDLVRLTKAKSIPLIEDCAHAHGAHLKGKRAGTFGAIGCFSHYLTKVMTTGEGGSLIYNSLEQDKIVRSIRQFGKQADNSISHERWGGNYKMSEFNALLGTIELKRIEGRIRKRNQLARVYNDKLRGTSWRGIGSSENSLASHYKQIIIPPKGLYRDDIQNYLSSKGVKLTGGVYNIPLNRQPFVGIMSDENFPNTKAFSETHICPPCYPELEQQDVEYVSELLMDLVR